jgi:hypothetical protein
MEMEMEMVDYFAGLDRQFEAIGTIVIRGLPLDVVREHPLRAKGYFPIMSPTCVCVTDPYPCDDGDDTIIWLPDSGVRARKPTTLKNKSGEILEEFHVMRDADIVTETFTRRKAASFDPRTKRRGPLGTGLSGAPRRNSPQPRLVCSGDTLYMVVSGPDGSGGTMFEYIAVGSCETTSS